MRKILLSAVVLSALLATWVMPAHASSASNPDVKTTTTRMTIQKEIGAITVSGVTTVTLDNGRSFNIPATVYREAKAKISRQGARPNNTAFGDCGYSYTYLYNWGNRTYRLAVGFHVDAPAIDYSWGAYVNGAGNTYYDYHYTAGGGLAFSSDWAGGHTGTVPRADYYDADTYYGAAELWYGSWCFAAYTSDSTYVS